MGQTGLCTGAASCCVSVWQVSDLRRFASIVYALLHPALLQVQEP